jgi:hypothetical protein
MTGDSGSAGRRPTLTDRRTDCAVLDRFLPAGTRPIGVSLPALQESPGQVRDHVGLLVEGEVAGVQDVHLGVWHVPAVRLGLLDLEGGVVAAP